MSQDISNDPRILMVEYALKRLKYLTIEKKYKMPANKEKMVEAIGKINSVIKAMKYSYMIPEKLLEDQMLKEFELMGNQLKEAIYRNASEIEKNKLIAADLGFVFNILQDFRKRLALGNKVSMEKAVDVIAVKIVAVSKLAGKDNLYLCRVGDGKKTINIITNLKDIKKDSIVAAAILPPVMFEPEVSEAMFCSSRNLPEMQGHVGELVLKLPESELKEVKNHVSALLKEV
jgi:predicted RNA-binding protein with EMAP domain